MWLWTVQLIWILLIFVNLCQSQHFLNDAQGNYLGCYIDAGNRLLGGLHKDFPGTLTQNICNRFCFDKGFAFAGTEYSFQCFCSINRPSDDKKVPDSQCNTICAGNSTKYCGATWKISVYSTGYVPSISSDTQENYLGCYIDAGNRLLGGLHKDFPGTLTQNICSRFCLDNGFSFAGTEYSSQCFCSMNRPPDDKKAPEGQCDSKCAGNSEKMCGGFWRISVYNTAFMPTARSDTQENYLGCYIDAGNRLLGGLHKDFPGTLTQNICNQFCHDKGFSFAGTEYSSQCFCSMNRPPDHKKALDGRCDAKCAGNRDKICGGTWRLSVYSTGYVPPEGSEEVKQLCETEHFIDSSLSETILPTVATTADSQLWPADNRLEDSSTRLLPSSAPVLTLSSAETSSAQCCVSSEGEEITSSSKTSIPSEGTLL